MSRVRFAFNNYIDLDSSASVTYSSQSSTATAHDLAKQERYKSWSPTGNFTIGSTNNKIYINDGADKTITLTSANYSTGGALATHITTQLNASSSGWLCSYNIGGNLKFTITRTSSGTLRYSQTTDASWSTLGFTGSIDVTATSFVSDEIRNHTDEWIVWDLTSAQTPTFFALIGQIDQVFPLNTATITLQGNGSNVWTSPSYSQALTLSDDGIYYYLVGTNNYRYWRLKIVDTTNTSGPSFTLSQCYLGDYETTTIRNISTGFSKSYSDYSQVTRSINGTKYGTLRPRAWSFDGMAIEFLEAADRSILEQLSYDHSVYKPFYISLDPDLTVSDDYSELTKYVTFDSQPSFDHIKVDIYSMKFSVTEAV